MSLDTKIILSKGIAYVLIGFFSPWAAALAQWLGTGEWPPAIAWVVIIAASVIGGATQWLSFCSTTWSEYRTQQIPKQNG